MHIEYDKQNRMCINHLVASDNNILNLQTHHAQSSKELIQFFPIQPSRYSLISLVGVIHFVLAQD